MIRIDPRRYPENILGRRENNSRSFIISFKEKASADL
jgi:hypothetical protein